MYKYFQKYNINLSPGRTESIGIGINYFTPDPKFSRLFQYWCFLKLQLLNKFDKD